MPGRSACLTSGVVSSAVTSTRIGFGQRVLRQERQRLRRARRAARRARAARPAPRLLGRRPASRPSRADRPLGLEHEAAAIDRRHQRAACRRLAAVRCRLRHDARPARGRSGRSRAARRRGARRASRRRRRSSPAGTRRGPRAAPPRASLAATTNEMFSSDEPWAMATMLMPASRQRGEHARRDAEVARHADADHRDGGQAGLHLDAVDLLARDLVAELLQQAVARALGRAPRAPRSRSTAPTTTARSARR